jgi:hypothetical protein
MNANQYQAGNANLFATAARDTEDKFTCASDCHVGAYGLRIGDEMTVMDDGDGLFSLYVDWADGCLGRLNTHDINKLAGHEVIGMCTCCDPVHYGDDPNCPVHGRE